MAVGVISVAYYAIYVMFCAEIGQDADSSVKEVGVLLNFCLTSGFINGTSFVVMEASTQR